MMLFDLMGLDYRVIERVIVSDVVSDVFIGLCRIARCRLVKVVALELLANHAGCAGKALVSLE